MRFTLRTKFILLTTLLVTVIMAESTYFYTIRELKSKRTAVEDQIQRIARNIATIKLLDQQDWSVYQNYISQIMEVNDDIVYIAIYDDRQSLRAHTINFDLLDIERPSSLTRMDERYYVRQLDQGAVARESQKDLKTQKVNIEIGEKVIGKVHVGFSLIEINDEIRNNIYFNIVMAFIFIIVFSGLAALLSRKLTQPLERLSGAMTAIVHGDLNQKVVVENKDEIGNLATTFNNMVKGLQERRIIEDLSRQLSVTVRLDQLSGLIEERLGGAIGAEKARLFLRRREQNDFFIEAVSSANPQISIRFTSEIDGFFSEKEEGFTVNQAPRKIQEFLRTLGISPQELVIPMFVKRQTFGFLAFDHKNSQPGFDSKQRHFASILANQAALALENATLYDELREQERLKRELEIARDIQKSLLPAAMPEVNGFQFDGICVPALEVGGDYFDIFEIDHQSTGIVIADVSGKGTSASFYMAEIKGMMAILAPVFSSPKQLLIELNRRLFGRVDRRVFTTMIYGLLDHETNKFMFARAGHNPLLVLRSNGNLETITPVGLALGLTDGYDFERELEEREISLKTGDTVLLYTDGIVEAMNDSKEIFGEERFCRTIQINHQEDLVSLRNNILSSVENFEAGAHQHDDITLLACRKMEPI